MTNLNKNHGGVQLDRSSKELHFLYKVISPSITALLVAAVIALFKMNNQVAILTEKVTVIAAAIEKNEALQKQIIINAKSIDEIEKRIVRLENKQR